MKPILELRWRETPPGGYVFYDINAFKATKKYCAWWAYPAIVAGMFLLLKKLQFYRFLNNVGIMHTPEACNMRFSDIWR